MCRRQQQTVLQLSGRSCAAQQLLHLSYVHNGLHKQDLSVLHHGYSMHNQNSSMQCCIKASLLTSVQEHARHDVAQRGLPAKSTLKTKSGLQMN